MQDNLDEIIKKMVSSYEKNNAIVSNIKKTDFTKERNIYNLEENIIENIDVNKNQNFSFAGTDSGFVNKQFNFANITIIKEAGAVFRYKDSKLEKTIYYPNSYNLAKPYLTTSSLELEEVMWNTSILRLEKEVSLSSKIIENEEIKFMLLDGSIIPQYISRPTEGSKLFKSYNDLLDKFYNLYNLSKNKNVFLVGCIEDSRANLFYKFIENKILNKHNISEIYDSFFVFSLLKKNQRTCVIKYTDSYKEHPILKDYPKEFADNLYVMYLKLSEDDYPLRLEFIYFKEFGLSLKEYTDFIASNISSVSAFNPKYVYPSCLIEADLRSRLKPDEIDSITRSIFERTKFYGFRLFRRESRIF
ncbi:MAG: DNA double-strand break repair nuclease NurA [Candidatus ainarchaeum sp.]|nr:DNA double-strand break repair nuclease NurA [Candidatus ainarchaeum sp.]MDD3976069.1 DNA double-strand break repair nuclease NurA [Candidatus ainarchaeum sp.]